MWAVGWKKEMTSEVQWVEELPLAFWKRMAEPLRGKHEAGTPQKVRSASIAGAHTAAAFVNHRFVVELQKHPWCLCVGDIEKIFGRAERSGQANR